MKTINITRVGDHPTVAFAAAELKRILRAMDPEADIAVRCGGYDPAAADVLWVGADPALGVGQSDADAIAVDVKNGRGVIAGSNPRAALIAVYRFLREAGCRFIRPGADGEVIPHADAAGIVASLRESASYPHRGVCIEGSVSYENVRDMIDFLPKVAMNEYFVQFAVPTEFFARWYEHRGSTCLETEWGAGDDPRRLAAEMTAALEGEIEKRSLRYHKVGHGWTCEPFGIEGGGWDRRELALTDKQRAALAEVAGKRELWGGIPLNTNLCYSNDSVRATVTDAIVAYAKSNPRVDVIHFWLADGENNHCECDNCKKMRPADWYVKMLNELDERLTAAGLATKIVFLIYVDLLWEPRTERIENPDRFILMFAPITRNYGENYGDCLDCRDELPPYERNRLQMPRSLSQNIARLRRWQAIFDGDSFDFDYHLMWAHVGDIGYEKCARNLFCDMRDLEKIGLGGMVSCQVQRCFFPTAMPFVAMAGALWNKNADFDGLADDWYGAAYGEPGARVRDAMKTLSASCGLYEDAPVLWDPAKARRGLDALRAVCAEAPDIFSLKAYCEYLERLFALFDAMDGGEKEKVRAAAGTLFDWAWENEQALQPLFDAHNTVGVIRRMQGRRGF